MRGRLETCLLDSTLKHAVVRLSHAWEALPDLIGDKETCTTASRLTDPQHTVNVNFAGLIPLLTIREANVLNDSKAKFIHPDLTEFSHFLAPTQICGTLELPT